MLWAKQCSQLLPAVLSPLGCWKNTVGETKQNLREMLSAQYCRKHSYPLNPEDDGSELQDTAEVNVRCAFGRRFFSQAILLKGLTALLCDVKQAKMRNDCC